MTVRANVTVALMSGGHPEPDVFLQGEQPFGSREGIQEMILGAVADMDEGDLIWFLVVPADMSNDPRNMAVAMAYFGPRPNITKLAELGFLENVIDEYMQNH